MTRICLPLQTPRRQYGALWLEIPEENWDQVRHSDNLHTLANQAAIALAYARARANFEALRASSLIVEAEPSVYFYRLQMGAHVQTGLAACYSIDEYDRDLIRKHERTRRDKEDDRTRHILTLGAQTGPVFLTYRAVAAVDAFVARKTAGAPDVDFTGKDGALKSWSEIDQFGICAHFAERGAAPKPVPLWNGPAAKFVRLEWV